MKKWMLLLMLAAVVATAPIGHAFWFVVDEFDAPTPVIVHFVNGVTLNNPHTYTGLAPASTIGGARYTEVFQLNPASDQSVSAQLTPGVKPSYMNFVSSAEAWMGLKLVWDANGAGLGGMDVTTGGLNTQISLHISPIIGTDAPDFTDAGDVFALTMKDTDGDFYALNVPVKPVAGTVIPFPFLQFAAGNPALDLDKIDMIMFEAYDYTSDGLAHSMPLGFIQATPEPGTILLGLLTGLVGYVFRRRMNKKEA